MAGWLHATGVPYCSSLTQERRKLTLLVDVQCDLELNQVINSSVSPGAGLQAQMLVP